MCIPVATLYARVYWFIHGLSGSFPLLTHAVIFWPFPARSQRSLGREEKSTCHNFGVAGTRACMTPQNTPLWLKDYFELKAIGEPQTWEKF